VTPFQSPLLTVIYIRGGLWAKGISNFRLALMLNKKNEGKEKCKKLKIKQWLL
jgi:hypothetical protein